MLTTAVTPPTDHRLTDVDTVLAEIGDDVDVALIETLIDRASSIIEGHLGGPLGVYTATEHHVPGRQWYLTNADPHPLILAHAPVTTVTSVIEGTTTLVAGTDYVIEAATGALWRLSNGVPAHWCWNVSVSYSGGYGLPGDPGTRTLPHAIETVCLGLIKAMYYAQAQDPNITSEQVEGVGRVTYGATRSAPGALDDAMKCLLAPFCHRPVLS